MEMENLHNDWISAKSSINCNVCGTNGIRRQTTIDRISTTYLQFGIIAILMGGWGWRPLYLLLGEDLTIAVAFSGFMFISSCKSFFLYFRMRSIKCATMSLEEVARRVNGVRKSHLRFMLINIPLAVVLLSYIGFAVAGENESVLFGMLFGATLGAIIGLRIFFRTMREYKDILDE